MMTPTPDQWDTFVSSHPRAHVLQLSNWGALKRAYGWHDDRVTLTDSAGNIIAGAQILFRPLPFRLGTMAYLAMGPYLTDPALESDLWHAIDQCARKHHAAFLKWEPGIYLPGETPPDFARLGFRESLQTVQPSRTILIDIRAGDETILGRMNQGTRRKIRQSLKNDIRYYEGSSQDIAVFNQLIQGTGARNEFGVHEPAYYQLAYDLFVPRNDAALILAEHEGDPLAGIMIFAKGQCAWYLYGASSDVKRNLMATYGVQWQAIQWAKARGCHYYDLWGIPDEDEATLEAQFQTREDGLWGVYGFKRGWGGNVVRSAGTWDKVYNPIIYSLYRAIIRLRK